MTLEAWIAVLSAACALLVTLTTWGFFSGRFSGGVESRAARLAEELRDYKIDTSRRFDDANERLSKAMSYVQSLESRCLAEFLHREVAEARFSELRREYNRLQVELDRLRGDVK